MEVGNGDGKLVLTQKTKDCAVKSGPKLRIQNKDSQRLDHQIWSQLRAQIGPYKLVLAQGSD